MTTSTKNRTYRVLIIDDSNNIHDDFRKVLIRSDDSLVAQMEAELFGDAPAVPEPLVHFTVDSAFQGDEGVAMLAKAKENAAPYSLAFVDMRMPPGLDGLATIVKLWEVDPQLQIVICSAYSDYSWTEIINRVGRNDRLVILRKPFDNIEVLQLAHALTEKWSLARQVQSQLQNLETIVAQRTVELHTTQILFRLILENANDIVVVVDAAGKGVYSSPSRERLLGFTEAEIADLPPFAMVHPDDVAHVEEVARRVFANSHRETVLMRCRKKDESYLHFEASMNSVKDDNGQQVYLVITARDITDRYKREVQARLNQKLESIGLLAAGIAHEINTPTQFISDNARFLAEAFEKFNRLISSYRQTLKSVGRLGVLPNELATVATLEEDCEVDYYSKEVPRTLEQSLEGLTRVAKIVRSLKEFSHPGSPHRTPIDLNHAIENAITVCRHEWKYVAEVVTDLDPTLPLVPCMADEMNQAILNLLINAGHAVGEARAPGSSIQGKITVTTKQSDGWAVISITDTGVGIPEAIHERIFEPFFTTKPMGKGTGQGLPIVHSVVVGKHQGKVGFTSEVGKGTTFTLHLPLVCPEIKPASQAAA